MEFKNIKLPSAPVGLFVKGLLAIVAVIVVLGGVKDVVLPALGIGGTKVTNVTLYQKFEDQSELSFQKLEYTNVGIKIPNEEWNVLGFSLPGTSSNVTVVYSGEVTAGADLSKVKVDINDAANTINISVPAVHVLKSTVTSGSVKLVDESGNPLNKFDIEEYDSLLKQLEDNNSQKAVDEGLLTRAQNHAEDFFVDQTKEFVKGSKYKDYDVVVNWEKPVSE